MRYTLAGVFLSGLLVGAILFVRMRSPQAPSYEWESARAQGPANAPVEIIEYSDFECPACGKAQPALLSLMEEFSGEVRLVYQHFPLSGHRWSGIAHQAAECAARQNRFWPYHDRLYRDQAHWSKSPVSPLEDFVHYASEVGLDLDAFGRCLSDPAAARKIQEERRAGEGMGIRSTPSFFVNGELVVGAQNLREKVEKLLNP